MLSSDSKGLILYKILKFILLLFVWLNYEDQWITLFNKYIIGYLDISNKLWLWTLLIVVCIICYKKIKKWYKNNLVVNDYYILALIFVITIYVKYRISGTYYFYSLIECCNISLCDIIAFFAFVSVLVFIFNRINRKKLRNNGDNKNIILTDNPISSIEEDKLEYKSHVKKIIETFMNVDVSEHSWSMGIIAAWGSGKTSFENMIEEQLKIRSQKVLIIKYNPRNASCTNKIQEDFFNTFRNALKPYDNRVDRMIEEYMKALKILNDNKVLNAIISLWSNNNKEDIRKKIGEVLKSFPYKVIIFIDDLDRLLLEEIIEVLKIIDGNACFPNVIYISSYDKEQVNRIIDDKYKNKHCFFSDKFFNYEFMLPIRPKEIIFSFLRENIADISNDESERNSITADIETQGKIITKYITTLRDAKRFVNQFKYDYGFVKEQVEFVDFLLVSIIKYKNQSIYKRLYEGEFITLNNNKWWIKDKIADDAIVFIDILMKLFPKDNYSSGWNRKIYDEKAFGLYFYYMVYDLISRDELENTLSGSWGNAKNWVDEIFKDDRVYELERYLALANFKDLGSRVNLGNFIRLLFYCVAKGYNKAMGTVNSLFDKSVASQIVSIYKYKSINEYSNFIRGILNDYPPYYHNLTGSFLINSNNGEIKEGEIIFTKKELLEFNLDYLVHSVRSCNIMGEIHMSILYSCIESIDRKTRKTTLDNSACKLIRGFINRSPEYYIKIFVRPEGISSNPFFNEITCEPFWRQIFGDEKQMKSFIFSYKLDALPNINCARNFWAIFEKNDYMPIESKGQWNVNEQIDKDLVILKEYLDSIISVEKEFREYKEDRLTQTLKLNDNHKYHNELQYFINKLNNIPLSIKYKDDLIIFIEDEYKMF